ncbi:MAG TPA: hypothetical protein VHT30_03635 [Acidimicrobiales bacterium]|nr:hypothetical protein [Acidimicrobiales bacterium]
MSDQSDAASLRYLERVLRIAVTEAEGASDPIAGRVIVALLGMAIAQGGSDLVAAYVCPVPGENAIYEVRRLAPHDEGSDETGAPEVVARDLTAGAAIRATVRLSRDGDGAITMVGRSPSGVERAAINRADDGVLEFLFPAFDAYRGPEEDIRQALQRWDETMRRWRQRDQPSNGAGGRPAMAVVSAKAPSGGTGAPNSGAGTGAGDGGGDTAAPDQGIAGTAAPDQATGGTADPERSATRDQTAAGTAAPERAEAPHEALAWTSGEQEPGAPSLFPPVPSEHHDPGRALQVPSAAEIAEAIQFSLMEMTVDVNMPEMENLIRGTIEASFQALAPVAPPPPPPVVVEPPPIDHAALAERIANRLLDRLPVIVDPVYRNAAGQAVDALASRLDPFMSKTQDQLDQINTDPGRKDREQIQSSLDEVLATLATIMGIQQQLLAGVSRQVALEARAAGTVDRLDLEIREMRDQARTWRTALQALTEELSATTRRSESSGDRMLSALGRELDEFGNRLRRQLAAVETAAKRGAADPAATEALNRLTARLARGEAQAELLLERLDQLLGDDDGQ